MEQTQEKLKIEGLLVLTVDDVENLVVGAIEGGSNYWYFISKNMAEKIYKKTEEMNGQPFVSRMMKAIERGLPVRVRDVENQKEVLGTLTGESWAKAEKLMMKQPFRRHFGDVLTENDDATTADVFFQLAVIGEVVYG